MFTNTQLIEITGINRRTYFRRLSELKQSGIITFETSKLIPKDKAIQIATNLGLLDRFIEFLKTQSTKTKH